MDAARWLPRTGPPAGGFIRFGAPGEGRVPRDGIFVIAYRTLDRRDLERWQRDAIEDCLDWFRTYMPVCRPPTSAAVLYLRDQQREQARRLWALTHALREAGVPVEMVAVRRPGRVVREDAIQVAAVPPSTR
jgi:hypothetical protein